MAAWSSCKKEFQRKYFGFADVSPEAFYHLQWTGNRWIHLGYRSFMFAYTMFWLVYGYIENFQIVNLQKPDPFWQKLSNWAELVMVLRFMFSFGVSVYGVVTRQQPSASENDKLRWFHITDWILFDLAAVLAIEIDVLYWVLLAPGKTRAVNLDEANFHIHAINAILMVCDAIMVAFPFRFLHFIYINVFGTVYTLFLVILHFTGVNSKVYPFTDFENRPGTTAGVVIGATLVVPLFVTGAIFGFYHFKCLIVKKILERKITPKCISDVESLSNLKSIMKSGGQLDKENDAQKINA